MGFGLFNLTPIGFWPLRTPHLNYMQSGSHFQPKRGAQFSVTAVLTVLHYQDLVTHLWNEVLFFCNFYDDAFQEKESYTKSLLIGVEQ